MSSFCNAKTTHIFSAKYINVLAIFQDRNFNVTLVNNFVKFWKTGPSFIFWLISPFEIMNVFKFKDGRVLYFGNSGMKGLRKYFKTSRKHAYSNILKILPPKIWKFSVKNSDIFQISAQNIDCGYSLEPPHWGSSKEYPQTMFLSRNKKDNVYPCKPQFYYIKVGFKGVKIIQACFRDGLCFRSANV